ncbi:MAG: SDR family oxidoreductase [Alphaproteobacteria bacterium]|nr:SDR family oxidoreductase [Alphaproteobacteria bacterium]
MTKQPRDPPTHEEPELPGLESELDPQPDWKPLFPGSERLRDKVAIVTGADSGIGRAVAVLFAREGACVAIAYLNEGQDAERTKTEVEKEGGTAMLFAGDLGSAEHCKRLIDKTIERFGRIDVLVNNAGEQHPDEELDNITEAQLRRTFQTNVFSMFFLTQAALAHLSRGAAIINTTSVTMYEGSAGLLDYSATKGAITAFTRSLSQNLVDRGIRVNAVAPGPIWTPLNPFGGKPADEIPDFGKNTPMGRPGQPNEVAPCFLFLASDDSSYMSGQVLHPNGGVIVGS